MPACMQDMTLIVPTWLLLGNAAAAFALNLAVYLLIGKTSALTMNIAGEQFDYPEDVIVPPIVAYGLGSPINLTSMLS